MLVSASTHRTTDVQSEEVRLLVEQVCKALVDFPENVTVTAAIGTNATIIEVEAPEDCRSEIIGRGGSLAESLRSLLRCVSGKHHRRYTLYILE